MRKEKAKELLDVIKAFADGKDIEYNHGTLACPRWGIVSNPSFCEEAEKYRIKPEITHKPYTGTDARILVGLVVRNKKREYAHSIIVYAHDNGVFLGNGERVSYDELLEHFVFRDGSVCGHKQ